MFTEKEIQNYIWSVRDNWADLIEPFNPPSPMFLFSKDLDDISPEKLIDNSTIRRLQAIYNDVTIGHKIVKTALSSVPIAGNALSEVFVSIVAEPSSKRRDKILIQIDSRLNELVSRLEELNLANNEVFLSTVSQAYQIAMRTHQEEKIQSLLNAITNSAVLDIEDNLQHMFLMFIDSFTEWHLRILVLLDNPSKVLQDKGVKTDFGMGSISQLFVTAYQELRGRDDFGKQIMKDLNNRGLINTSDDTMKTMMTGSGMIQSRTSELGKQFTHLLEIHFERRFKEGTYSI